jgi:hypothetical protein
MKVLVLLLSISFPVTTTEMEDVFKPLNCPLALGGCSIHWIGQKYSHYSLWSISKKFFLLISFIDFLHDQSEYFYGGQRRRASKIPNFRSATFFGTIG